MKKVAMSFLGMVFTLMAAHASAIEILDPPPPPLVFDNVLNFNSDLIPAGLFSDTGSFTLAQDSTLTFSNFNIQVENPLPPPTFAVNITDLMTILVDSTGATLGMVADTGLSSAFSLSAGDYQLRITGESAGSFGGFYSGFITVSAVPIPAAGLLFFSGIAALGLVRSKRAST